MLDNSTDTKIHYPIKSTICDHFLHRLVALALSMTDYRNKSGLFQHAHSGLYGHFRKTEATDSDHRPIEYKIGASGHFHHATNCTHCIRDLGFKQGIHFYNIKYRMMHGNVMRTNILIDIAGMGRHR